MATPSLIYDYNDLMAEVAYYRGWGRTDPSDSGKEVTCDAAVQTGYSWLLCPETIPSSGDQVPVQHSWSCMHKHTTLEVGPEQTITSGRTVSGSKDNGTSTLTASAASFYDAFVGQNIIITGVDTFPITAVASNTSCTVTGDASAASADTFSITTGGNYHLPDDFDVPVSVITFGANEGYEYLNWYDPERIHRRRQAGTSTGTPSEAAYRMRAFVSATSPARKELMLWPVPSSEFNLTYTYRLMPDDLDDTNKYPIFPARFRNVLRQACLAAAELDWKGAPGPHYGVFLGMLRGAIASDRRAGPHILGKMSDHKLIRQNWRDRMTTTHPY